MAAEVLLIASRVRYSENLEAICSQTKQRR